MPQNVQTFLDGFNKIVNMELFDKQEVYNFFEASFIGEEEAAEKEQARLEEKEEAKDKDGNPV